MGVYKMILNETSINKGVRGMFKGWEEDSYDTATWHNCPGMVNCILC